MKTFYDLKTLYHFKNKYKIKNYQNMKDLKLARITITIQNFLKLKFPVIAAKKIRKKRKNVRNKYTISDIPSIH